MITNNQALTIALEKYRAANSAVKAANAAHDVTINTLREERAALIDRIIEKSPERAQLGTLDAALDAAKRAKRKASLDARAELRAARADLASVAPSVLAVGDVVQAHGLAVSYAVKIANAE